MHVSGRFFQSSFSRVKWKRGRLLVMMEGLITGGGRWRENRLLVVKKEK
jgi:hypothetical protein